MISTEEITLSEIISNQEKLQGYLWDSNEKYPFVLRDNIFDFSKYDNQQNSFIIEALLYSVAKKCSWIIKHTGNYRVNKFEFNNLPPHSKLYPVKYLPHRLKKNNPDGETPIESVCFQQLWVPEKDSNCKNMDVLKMQALIFTGFNKQPKIS